jgi:hypothetical protein
VKKFKPGISLSRLEFIMDMRISSVTSDSQSVGMAAWQQRQQSSKDLFSALQSGDLAGAQKAFSALTGGTGNVSSNSPLAQIGQALQNGDVAGAQKAAQQLQAQRGGHHHHHGGQQTAQSATPTTSTVQPASGSGSLLNLTA